MYEYSCIVDRVVDGDTVDVVFDLGFDVRFFSRVRFLQDSLADQEVVIKTKLKDSRGKYGRVLGELWVDGVNINQTMVGKHLAVDYQGQSKDAVKEAHQVNREVLIAAGLFDPDNF
jgi:endonuclease YncB( thermonuclease family)